MFLCCVIWYVKYYSIRRPHTKRSNGYLLTRIYLLILLYYVNYIWIIIVYFTIAMINATFTRTFGTLIRNLRHYTLWTMTLCSSSDYSLLSLLYLWSNKATVVSITRYKEALDYQDSTTGMRWCQTGSSKESLSQLRESWYPTLIRLIVLLGLTADYSFFVCCLV